MGQLRKPSFKSSLSHEIGELILSLPFTFIVRAQLVGDCLPEAGKWHALLRYRNQAIHGFMSSGKQTATQTCPGQCVGITKVDSTHFLGCWDYLSICWAALCLFAALLYGWVYGSGTTLVLDRGQNAVLLPPQSLKHKLELSSNFQHTWLLYSHNRTKTSGSNNSSSARLHNPSDKQTCLWQRKKKPANHESLSSRSGLKI